MIELTDRAVTPTVDLDRFRAVVPRYQWNEIAVRLWGERSRERAGQRRAVVTTCAAAATSYAASPPVGGAPIRTTSVRDCGSAIST